MLRNFEARIAPAGYTFGAPDAIPAFGMSPLLLMICGIGIMAASMLVLEADLSAEAQMALLGAVRHAGSGMCRMAPFVMIELQMQILALLAAMAFPRLRSCCSPNVSASAGRKSTPPSRGPGHAPDLYRHRALWLSLYQRRPHDEPVSARAAPVPRRQAEPARRLRLFRARDGVGLPAQEGRQSAPSDIPRSSRAENRRARCRPSPRSP